MSKITPDTWLERQSNSIMSTSYHYHSCKHIIHLHNLNNRRNRIIGPSYKWVKSKTKWRERREQRLLWRSINPKPSSNSNVVQVCHRCRSTQTCSPVFHLDWEKSTDWQTDEAAAAHSHPTLGTSWNVVTTRYFLQRRYSRNHYYYYVLSENNNLCRRIRITYIFRGRRTFTFE